jgi:hypothetical protein
METKAASNQRKFGDSAKKRAKEELALPDGGDNCTAVHI